MPKPREESSRAGRGPRTAGGYPTREEIEQRAYQIYIERGGAQGQALQDWLQAERELLEKYREAAQAARVRVA